MSDNAILVLIGTLAGYGVSILEHQLRARQAMKQAVWESQQKRIDQQLEVRKKSYSRAFRYLQDLELARKSVEKLDEVLGTFNTWFPLNVINLPPTIIGALMAAINAAVILSVDLANDSPRPETITDFNQKMKAARDMLMNQADIAWLPEDLKIKDR